MKRKLLSKMLVIGIIIFILSSISGHSIKFEEESFDLELFSLKKFYYQGDPRNPNLEFDMEIKVKNNGPSDFYGRIEAIQEINIKFLGFNIPRSRRVTSEYLFIKSGDTDRFFGFYNNDYFRVFFPGTYEVCYKIYPDEPYNEDDDPILENNELCKSFRCFLFYIYPYNGWF